MTVAQLIEALKAIDPELEVYGGAGDIGRVLSIEVKDWLDGERIVVLSEEG